MWYIIIILIEINKYKCILILLFIGVDIVRKSKYNVHHVLGLSMQAVLRMRVRISYQLADGQEVLEQTEVSGFPENAFE